MTSSTSSSSAWRRLPWAGLLALALLLAGDALVFQTRAVWQALSSRDFFGVATARLSLWDAAHAPDEEPRLLVVGPSRVVDGFVAEVARKALPGVAVAKVGHPRFDPFVVRALVPDLLAARPSVVAFVWSELDTHRPLRLEPIPGSTAASLGAVRDLLSVTGWRFAYENRTSLYRLLGTSALGFYRNRFAFTQAGLDDVRHFAIDGRLKRRRALPRIFGEIVYWEGEANPVSPRLRTRVLDAFGPDSDRRFVDLSIDFVAEITPGRHARLQIGFVRRAVELLRAQGVAVVIVEGPMHPLAAELYDPGLRREFLAFMAELHRRYGVKFTRLEEMPPFDSGDFKDLFHTRGNGTFKLTRAIVRSARPLLRAGGPNET